MKQLSTQKWILSTLLIAALGSQYYFSTSSKNAGLIEMSSHDTPEQQAIVEITAALEKIKPKATGADIIKSMQPAEVSAAIEKTTQQKTEAKSPAACEDCVTLTKAEAERIRQILVEVTGKKSAEKATEVAETPAEKMKREREEREQKKRDADLDKIADEKEKQDLRDEKFRADFDRISSRCSDVDCYSSSLARALNRYTDRSKKISSGAVKDIFKEFIAKDLKDGLLDPENEKAQEALKTLMAEIPDSYKNIKTATIDLAKAVTAPKAIEANASFKQAEALRKANKLNESSTVFGQAMEQKAELERMLRSQQEAIKDGTESAEDKNTYSYYNVKYAKPASQWLADIMNSSNFSIEGTSSSVSVDPSQNSTTRGVVRGGNGNTATGGPIQNNIGNQVNNGNKMTLPTVQFGTTQQGSRGGRGSY